MGHDDVSFKKDFVIFEIFACSIANLTVSGVGETKTSFSRALLGWGSDKPACTYAAKTSSMASAASTRAKALVSPCVANCGISRQVTMNPPSSAGTSFTAYLNRCSIKGTFCYDAHTKSVGLPEKAEGEWIEFFSAVGERRPHRPQCLHLDLPDPLGAHAELTPELLQRRAAPVVHVPRLDDSPTPGVQHRQRPVNPRV